MCLIFLSSSIFFLWDGGGGETNKKNLLPLGDFRRLHCRSCFFPRVSGTQCQGTERKRPLVTKAFHPLRCGALRSALRFLLLLFLDQEEKDGDGKGTSPPPLFHPRTVLSHIGTWYDDYRTVANSVCSNFEGFRYRKRRDGIPQQGRGRSEYFPVYLIYTFFFVQWSVVDWMVAVRFLKHGKRGWEKNTLSPPPKSRTIPTVGASVNEACPPVRQY